MDAQPQPLVTVITIFFNAEKFIEEAIASVCAQTYTNWEYFLVDDGSTDQSAALVHQSVQSWPRKLRYLTHPGRENRGMSASRNRGLAEAQGKYVAFLDADDVWLPNKLKDQVALMEANPSAAMIYGRTEIWWSWTSNEADSHQDYCLELGVVPDTLVKPPKLLLLLLENKVQSPTTCSALIRRSVFSAIGGFQDAFRGMFEDQAFFAKLCLKFPVFVSGRCWARYRQHPESCCAQAEKAGTAAAARLPLLQWLGKYFTTEGVTDTNVLGALRHELWPHQHPALARWTASSRELHRRLHNKLSRLRNFAFRAKPQRKDNHQFRIVVEPSDYVLRNVGDTAMMQIAAERLSRLWPAASILIFSDVPERMPSFASNAKPLSAKGRRIWHEPGFLSRLIESYFPGRVANWLLHLGWVSTNIRSWENGLRRRWSGLTRVLLNLLLRRSGVDPSEVNRFFDEITKADLVIANGMGGIADCFPEYATELLDTLQLAIDHGACTAMVGQGLGPLGDPGLRERAQSVLRRVNFISLREERAGRPLLRELGVQTDHVITTGDDAIELAYLQRTKLLGAALGINIRLASYAEVNKDIVDQLRPVLRTFAETYQAALVPIGISHGPYESDIEALEKLLDGVPLAVPVDTGGPHTLAEVLKNIRLCRVVVTGSYHAAVFALSTGIPVVGLANSAYYVDKFLGLADQFGCGCSLVHLKQGDFATRLLEAVDQTWLNAESLRPRLLEAASKQVERGHFAYRRLQEIVELRQI
jgi:colanic acid/amylovoran biosynthesis protein